MAEVKERGTARATYGIAVNAFSVPIFGTSGAMVATLSVTSSSSRLSSDWDGPLHWRKPREGFHDRSRRRPEPAVRAREGGKLAHAQDSRRKAAFSVTCQCATSPSTR